MAPTLEINPLDLLCSKLQNDKKSKFLLWRNGGLEVDHSCCGSAVQRCQGSHVWKILFTLQEFQILALAGVASVVR